MCLHILIEKRRTRFTRRNGVAGSQNEARTPSQSMPCPLLWISDTDCCQSTPKQASTAQLRCRSRVASEVRQRKVTAYRPNEETLALRGLSQSQPGAHLAMSVMQASTAGLGRMNIASFASQEVLPFFRLQNRWAS